MNNVKVKYLKEKLQEALDKLEEYEDDAKVCYQCNTYGMTGWVLEIPHTGFVNIMDIEVEEEDEDEDEEE